MITLNAKQLKNAALIYLALPSVIFFAGWLNIAAALIFSVIIIAAVIISIISKNDVFISEKIEIPKKAIVILAVISFIWCLWSGLGGFFYQASDNKIRNMIIKDLVRYPWPVIYPDGTSMLCYYINYWMLPALTGKAVYLISGSLKAGYAVCNVVLLLWSTVGIIITLSLFSLLTCKLERSKILISVLLFILFSGMDSAMNSFIFSAHIEWWCPYQYSSNTTCLFWVYNQAVPAWIATLCVINERSVRSLALIGMLLFPFSPLPFIGLFYLCIVKGFVLLADHIKEGNKIGAFLGQVFSPQNLLAIVSPGLIFLSYFGANAIVTGKSTGFRVIDAITSDTAETTPLVTSIIMYLLFVILEFAVLSFLLMGYAKKDTIFKFVVGSLFVIPFIQFGNTEDFCMRASIPSVVYLCYVTACYIQSEWPPQKYFMELPARAKKDPVYIVSFLIVLVTFVLTEVLFRLEMFYCHAKLLVPFTIYGLLYGFYYLRNKYPETEFPFKNFVPILKPRFAAVMIIVFLGAMTPFVEFKRGISYTMVIGSVFNYKTNESIGDDIASKYNFVSYGYTNSMFYKYFQKK